MHLALTALRRLRQSLIGRFERELWRRGRQLVPMNTEPRALLALIERLHPIHASPLIRLGPDGDGGYLVPDDLAGIAALFSTGVGSISGFEAACAERGIAIHCADGTLRQAPDLPDSWRSLARNLGLADTPPEMTLATWIAGSGVRPDAELMLQMDIEGSEYETLAFAPDPLIARFRNIVVEVHHLHYRWQRSQFKLARAMFEKLLSTHACVHIHPNNDARTHHRTEHNLPPPPRQPKQPRPPRRAAAEHVVRGNPPAVANCSVLT